MDDYVPFETFSKTGLIAKRIEAGVIFIRGSKNVISTTPIVIYIIVTNGKL